MASRKTKRRLLRRRWQLRRDEQHRQADRVTARLLPSELPSEEEEEEPAFRCHLCGAPFDSEPTGRCGMPCL